MRNSLYIRLLVFCLASSWVSAEDQTALQMSIEPPLQLFPEWYDVAGLRLNILWARNADVAGLDLGVLNETTGELSGVSLGVCTGAATSRGMQASFIFARADGVKGIQLAGLTTYSSLESGAVEGVQVAGVSCLTHDLTGLQLAGGCCRAEGIRGVQLSAWNIGGELVGVQIGLVNYCDDLAGLQIGILNICSSSRLLYMPLLRASF